ncbi:hypothetical protein Tco_1416954 [Tanacetum coccineum]
MRPSEIHKFCDATLRRTLEGLKSYYNDVKYGYVQKELTNDELEFLKLFEEEIEVRLKYQDQMRRWEMLIPSCFVIFDLEPFLFDFDFNSEIIKSFPCLSCCLCHLAILCLDQHAHTLHLLGSSLIISPEAWFLRSYL